MKRWKAWRLSRASIALPTSQLIFEPFFRFYVTGSSLMSPGEPPMLGGKWAQYQHLLFPVNGSATVIRVFIQFVNLDYRNDVPLLQHIHISKIGITAQSSSSIALQPGSSLDFPKESPALVSISGHYPPIFNSKFLNITHNTVHPCANL